MDIVYVQVYNNHFMAVFPPYCRGWSGTTAVSYTSHARAHPPFSNHVLSCPSLYYMTPHRPRPSSPSRTSYDMLFFTQSPSSFRNPCPSHLNWFRFTTSDTNSILILSLISALHPSKMHHASIVPSSSLSAPILHSTHTICIFFLFLYTETQLWWRSHVKREGWRRGGPKCHIKFVDGRLKSHDFSHDFFKLVKICAHHSNIIVFYSWRRTSLCRSWLQGKRKQELNRLWCLTNLKRWSPLNCIYC